MISRGKRAARRLALGSGLLAGATCAAAEPKATTKTAPAVATVTAPASQGADDGDEKPKVLLLGDSMMRVGVGPVLRRALAKEIDADVTMHAKSATGLARPDTYDWPAALKGLLRGTHFAKAIVYLGSNDCQDLTAGDEHVAYGTPEWEQAYRARVKDILGQLCAAADKVLWLELPPMRNKKFNTKITALNALLASEVKASACGSFIAVARVLATAKGGYVQYRPVGKRNKKVREDDGVHITQTGGHLVTDALLSTLR
jgi:hypothetical protein